MPTKKRKAKALLTPRDLRILGTSTKKPHWTAVLDLDPEFVAAIKKAEEQAGE